MRGCWSEVQSCPSTPLRLSVYLLEQGGAEEKLIKRSCLPVYRFSKLPTQENLFLHETLLS